MNSNQHLPAAWFIGLCAALFLITPASAQTDVTAPIDIPLTKVIIGSGDNSYEKLGIWASIGGGQQGLFEFDTGGSGFYAASNTQTPWWGAQSSSTGTPFTELYSSGFQYTGTIATGQVDIFSSRTASTPSVSSATNTLVGQTTTIVDTKTDTTLWDSSSTLASPPIDQTFYGDFGLSLKDSSNGIVNMLAQLNYDNSSGVRGGFIVHAGAHGRTDDAYLQVGVTAAQMAAMPILFSITPSGTTTFPVSGYSTYSLQLLSGSLSLANGSDTYQNASLPVTLDTGNQTPVIFDGSVPNSLISLDGTTDILIPGTSLNLTATSQSDAVATLLQLIANTTEGVNKVDVTTPTSGTASFNVGLPIFEQYDIAFDFQDELVGLIPISPVPEPSPALLLTLGALVLVTFLRKRQPLS